MSLTDCNWNRECFTSRQQWSQWPLSCLKKKKKILHQKVTKQTGQCLTLSSVHLDLLSCCCFCPSFWAKSLHVGIHSTALTSLLGHELSYLWDMNRTWPRAQITEREEERPWQQRAVAQLSPSSPLCSLVDFDFFFLLSVACCCWELWLGLLKLISMQKAGRGQLFFPPRTATSCVGEGTGVSASVCRFGWSWDVIHHVAVRRTQQA